MNKTNLTQHPCSNKCSDFEGEQCNHCLISNDSEFPNSSNSDFAIGDTVVFIDASKSDHLMTVTQVQKNGVLLDGNSNFALNHLIRHATVLEFTKQRRFPALTTFDEAADIVKTTEILSDDDITYHTSPLLKVVTYDPDHEKHYQNAMASQKEVS